jgi:hypothetical protein
MLVYTRDQMRAGRIPHLLRLESSAARIGAVEHPLTGCLVDTGLYGSLVSSLLKRDFLSRDCGVLFLTSRNPYIHGFANVMAAAGLVTGRSVDHLDVIRILDTAEAMLKPFDIGWEGALPTLDTSIRVADPVRYVASAGFLWAGYRHAKESAGPSIGVRGWLSGLDALRADSQNWYLRDTVPKWEGASKLVLGWPHGLIPPMDRLSGFAL